VVLAASLVLEAHRVSVQHEHDLRVHPHHLVVTVVGVGVGLVFSTSMICGSTGVTW